MAAVSAGDPTSPSELDPALGTLGNGERSPSDATLDCVPITETQVVCAPRSSPSPSVLGGPGASSSEGGTGLTITNPGEGDTGGENGTEAVGNGTWLSVAHARSAGGFVYDPVTQSEILFGGIASGEALGDTWEYQNGNWTRLFIASSLSVHAGISMAYDGLDDYVLLFGGYRGAHYLSETWTYQSGAWSWLRDLPVSPAPRAGAALAYDPADHVVVLYGGYSTTHQGGAVSSTYFGDTWYYAGGSWTQAPLTISPGPRANASLVYDPALGELVLFGGAFNGRPLNDTWTFREGAWTDATSTVGAVAPAARSSAAVTWDDANRQIVLVGGQGASGPLGDAWAFRGASWHPLPPGPSARAGAMMAYDPNLELVVLFGGTGGSGVYADVWLLGDSGWTQRSADAQIAARAGASVALDGATGEVLLFGGSSETGYLSDTWTYTRGVWSPAPVRGVAPPPRANAGLAYVQNGTDRTQGFVVLFGGYDGAYLGDTWAYTNGTWTPLAVTNAPSPRSGMVLSPDGATGSLFLYGGLGASGYLSDTWQFNASVPGWAPVERAGSSGHEYSPSARAFASSTFDPATGAVLIFGGLGESGYLGDTWEVTAPNGSGPSQWTAFSDSGPSARSNASLAWNPTVPSPSAVLVGGTNLTNASINDMWKFVGGTWELIPPAASEGGGGPPEGRGEVTEGETEATSPAPRSGGASIYSPSDGYLIAFGGFDGSSVRSDTWAWIVLLAQPMLTHPVVDAGVEVQYQVAIYGGTTPYTYGWDFGDGNTSTEAAPLHAYATAASTAVERPVSLTVTDANGNVSRRTLSTWVYPSLVASWHPAGSYAEVGVSGAYSAEVSGGAPPVRTHWDFGDGTRSTGASTNHTFGASGNYSVTFGAHSFGGTAYSSAAGFEVKGRVSVQVQASHLETDVGFPVNFTAHIFEGVGPHRAHWSFGDGAVGETAEATHTYGLSGTYEVHLEVDDAFEQAAVATAVVVVNPLPSISASSAAPYHTDIGFPVQFSGAAVGGTGDLAWQWSYGDGQSGEGATAYHAFREPGTYTIALWANDTIGASSETSVTVVVEPLPNIDRFAASASHVRAGALVSLTTEVSGGVEPYSYAYSGLPEGCVANDRPSVDCPTSTWGSYDVTVYLTDAVGARDSSEVSFTVDASPTSVLDLENPGSWAAWTIIVVGLIVLGAAAVWAWQRRVRGFEAPPPGPGASTGTQGSVERSVPQGESAAGDGEPREVPR